MKVPAPSQPIVFQSSAKRVASRREPELLANLKMWKTIQLLVTFAVLASNVHYRWTPNGYVASLMAFLAALFVTAIPIMISDLIRLFARLRAGFARLLTPSAPAIKPAERYRAAPPARLGFRGRLERDAT